MHDTKSRATFTFNFACARELTLARVRVLVRCCNLRARVRELETRPARACTAQLDDRNIHVPTYTCHIHYTLLRTFAVYSMYIECSVCTWRTYYTKPWWWWWWYNSTHVHTHNARSLRYTHLRAMCICFSTCGRHRATAADLWEILRAHEYDYVCVFCIRMWLFCMFAVCTDKCVTQSDAGCLSVFCYELQNSTRSHFHSKHKICLNIRLNFREIYFCYRYVIFPCNAIRIKRCVRCTRCTNVVSVVSRTSVELAYMKHAQALNVLW